MSNANSAKTGGAASAVGPVLMKRITPAAIETNDIIVDEKSIYHNLLFQGFNDSLNKLSCRVDRKPKISSEVEKSSPFRNAETDNPLHKKAVGIENTSKKETVSQTEMLKNSKYTTQPVSVPENPNKHGALKQLSERCAINETHYQDHKGEP